MKSYNEILESSKSKLQALMYATTFCGPCKKLIPILEKVSVDNYDLTIIQMDVEDYPNPFNVRTVPSTIFFKDGKALRGIQGFVSEPQLREAIRNF